MTGVDDLDFAKVAPCPNCGTPVRFMGGVPIAGDTRDPVFARKAWCQMCLHAGTVAAVRGTDRGTALDELRGNLLGLLAA